MKSPHVSFFNVVLTAFFFFFMTLSHSMQAQSADTLRYSIITTDGNTFTGHLMSSDTSAFIINTDSYGIVTIDVDKVAKMYQIDSIISGKKVYWHSNIQSARYFWAPNGYGLQKGEGYYQNTWVLFNQVSYGFSDYFSAGFGLMPLFIFGGSPFPIWVTPKFSVPIVENKWNVGAGGLFGTILGESDTGFGLAYATSTHGSRDKNISFGLGWGYTNGAWASTPLINVSGIVRIGKKGGYLMTENYFINFGTDDFLGVISVGGRNLIGSVSIDYGLFIPLGLGIETFFAVPWLGITVPFKKHK